jgi:hypothetical protein
MGKTLHILNGNSTAQIMEKSSIEGDVIIWREMLCDGPLQKEVGSDKFWITRYSFFENELGVPKLEYYDKTIKEIVKIENIANYKEVVLWFEYDLFCQINLLGLCKYLLNFYRKDVKFSMICTGKEKGKSSLQSLSDYSPEDYQNLLNNRITLSRNNLLFAEDCWNLFVENDREKLKEYDFNKNSKFKYLQLAINQHLQRFPQSNGLDQIENKILKLINFEPLTKKDLIRNLLLWQKKETVYGFGDIQYIIKLDKLKKYYFVKNDNYVLNEKGKELIE